MGLKVQGKSMNISANGLVMASPDVLEPPSGLSFGELIDWHLRRGTRPLGSDKQGEPWKKVAFADDVGVSDKQVRNWISNKSLPNDVITIERVLFGRNQEHQTAWRMELRDALKRTRAGNASPSAALINTAPDQVIPAANGSGKEATISSTRKIALPSTEPAVPVPPKEPMRPQFRNWIAGAVVSIVAVVISVLVIQRTGTTSTGTTSIRAIDIAAHPPFDQGGPNATAIRGGSASSQIGKRVALFIGNATYQKVESIKNSVNDAIAVSELFRSLGFSVTLRTNLESHEFANALRAFQDEAEKAEIAIIYYSGHALEVSGTNYLIPTDATISSETDIETEAIMFNALLSATAGAKRLRLLLLDACRSNPLKITDRTIQNQPGTKPPLSTETTRSISPGLAKVEVRAPNTLIAYAAAAGQIAADETKEEKNHGPFAAALVKYLGKPEIDIRNALGFVRDEVLRTTDGRQEPFIYTSLGGEFVSLVQANHEAVNRP
jgi:hypothetical protein